MKNIQRASWSLWFLCVVFATPIWGEPQRDIAVTIYNNNLALVRDVRPLSIERGIVEVKFTDVASQIDPTSVHFTSLTAPESVTILEQNYEYDLVSPSKILEKYIDKSIRVFTEGDKVFEGILLSSQETHIVLSDPDGGIRTLQGTSVLHIEYPALPEGFITRPTLLWLLQNDRAGRHQTEVSYLTRGVNWHAEYVAVVNQNDTQLDLGGWVSIENTSGATYEDAKLKLIAGDVHRVEERKPTPLYRAKADLAVSAAPQFEEKAFFEYHMYTLQRRATIKDKQIKQMSLFPNARVEVTKIFTYDGRQDDKKVRVNLEFQNSSEAGLGLPLPKGKVRVYKQDEDESLQFIGEDLIDHTPKDERVRVYLGNAFDVVGERSVQEHERISDRVREEEVEVKLRNHKDDAITIIVVEHLYGDWKILISSHEYRKKDARTIEFDVPVPKDSESIVTYRVRYTW
ncbi:MAG: DUF4139 domain-containing protein [Gemmatimonadota bacterium]|nr:MAG: DUF4139 domain-containing protein [Gemmatimonadota bacterium]